MKGSRAELIFLLEDPWFTGWRHAETRAEYEEQGEADGVHPKAALYRNDLLVYDALRTYTVLKFKEIFLDELLEENGEDHGMAGIRGVFHVDVDAEDASTVTLSFY